MIGIQQINGVLLVLFDAVVALVKAAGYAHQFDALEQLLGVVEHGQMVAVEVRLAFGAVDDELVDLADAAADLEGGREHRAAHADHAGLADAAKDRLRVLQFFPGQRLHELGFVLVIVLDDDGHEPISFQTSICSRATFSAASGVETAL